MTNTYSTLQKGSIFLTKFPFTNLRQTKIRPVVVLRHNIVYDDVIVAAISSVAKRHNFSDTILISSSEKNFSKTGLKKQSVILTNKIVTINKNRLFHKLGNLPDFYLDELDKKTLSNFKIGLTNQTNSTTFIPYGRQTIDDDDVYSVVKTLRSDWLTTGPKVAEFEQAIAAYVGAKYAVAVSSGTAALHCAMYALGIGPGDEVIVPPMTFAATANSIVYQGATPVFSDVEPDTLLLDPEQIESKITLNTRAIIAVDYAGHPCDYDSLRKIADKNNLVLVADACHALGAEYKGQKAGSLADLNIFSFHPVKHITTGEGGMITTHDEDLAIRMRLFRNHGITRDPKQFTPSEEVSAPSAPSSMPHAPCALPFYYEMVDLGYNYRITDFQCTLGISQLQKLPKFLERRRKIATLYDEALADIPGIEPLGLRADVLPAAQSAKRHAPCEDRPLSSFSDPLLHACPVQFTEGDRAAYSTEALCSLHAYHLYVIKVDPDVLGIDRDTFFVNLRKKGIGVNVHYIPVHLHPFYKDKFNTEPGLCPVAEAAYEQIISIPMFPSMKDSDVEYVIQTLLKILNRKTQTK